MIGGNYYVRRKNRKQFGYAIIDEVKEMVSKGKTQKEIAEYFGLKDKFVIKWLLYRDRKKEKHIAAGIIPRTIGRRRKSGFAIEQSKEMKLRD